MTMARMSPRARKFDYDEVRMLRRSGYSVREIVAVIKERHGIEATHQAVHKAVRSQPQPSATVRAGDTEVRVQVEGGEPVEVARTIARALRAKGYTVSLLSARTPSPSAEPERIPFED